MGDTIAPQGGNYYNDVVSHNIISITAGFIDVVASHLLQHLLSQGIDRRITRTGG